MLMKSIIILFNKNTNGKRTDATKNNWPNTTHFQNNKYNCQLTMFSNSYMAISVKRSFLSVYLLYSL